MANRWCDGFGRYGGTTAYMLNGSSSQAWAQVDTAGFFLSAANPRTGTHALRYSGGAGTTERNARRGFGDQLDEVLAGFGIYFDQLPPIEPVLGSSSPAGLAYQLRDQANASQLSFVFGTDGAIVVYLRGEMNAGDVFLGQQIGRTIPCLGAGAFNHVEIYALAGASADGAIEVRVNEVTRLNLTGLTTCWTANVEFSQGAFCKYNFGALVSVVDIVDCFVNDAVDNGTACNDFIGDVKSAVLMVDGDTAQADFALSTGSVGYSLLNERPPVDSSYIDTAATTAESDFQLGAPPANLTEVLTARPFIRAFKDDAGTCEVAPNMSSGGTKGTVPSQPIATAAAYYDSEVGLDPDVAAPWNLASLTAALHVVERTA